MAQVKKGLFDKAVELVFGEYEDDTTKKCPQCGAIVQPNTLFCPECGWQFDDVLINEVIVPRSKKELLDLTIYCKSKLLNKKDYEYKDYKIKYEECIMKIKQFYGNDRDFSAIIAEYDNKKRKRKMFIIVSVAVVAILFILDLIISVAV
ncbi:MAG: zinc ribbon domain-containing protein [Paludibacteraceae bacterium]